MARLPLSPLAMLVSTVFLFSTHVFAVSAVLGIDLGTEYIKAALVKPGIPLEIVLTKDSRRKEISAVTFKPSPNGPKAGTYPERAYGSDAMALHPRFPGDVFPNLKPLLGLPADSAEVKEYALRHPALQVQTHKTRGTAAFKSAKAFTPEEEAWLVEELLAMELQAIKSNAEAHAGDGTIVRSAVLTVPPFYTVEEKRATAMAAELAGLKVLSLISDGLAVGLNYATSRQFPNINEGGKPEYHMVFDMGAGSTKATVIKFQSRTVKDIGKFNKTVQEVQVVGTGWDRTLGGDALNYLIVDDMVAQFVDSPKAKKAEVQADKVKVEGRTIAKLTKEAERLRHILSANQETQGSFEGLYNDVDFKYKINRATFEEMAAPHMERAGAAVEQALKGANIQIKDLDSVILHGGASRTPFVQKRLEKILGGADKIRTNVNSDEAAVFGAGFRAADISPSFRVKEIRVSDGAAYPAGMRWKSDEGKPKHQRLWTATSHLGAPAKEVTLPNHEDVTIEFYQLAPPFVAGATDPVEAKTKTLTTTNLTATVAELMEKYKCEKSDIHFKIGVRLTAENGEVAVTKASVECEADAEKEGIIDGVKNLFGFGKKDQQPLKDGEEASSSSTTESSSTSTKKSKSASSAAAAAAASAKAEAEANKKQLVVIPVAFSVEKTGIPQLTKEELTSVKDRLKAFDASDRARRQREEALNQLEGYTYKVRDLIESEAFVAASTAAERADLEAKNEAASEWLYGDGADASKDAFRAALQELTDIVVPIQRRIEEAAKRPELVKNLQEAIKSAEEFAADMKARIAEYDDFVASSSSSAAAAAAASSSSSAAAATATESTASAATTAAPEADDFDGLEDEPAVKTVTKMEDLDRELGPVPPLYTADDIKESEALYTSISAWLEEKVAAQAKLGPTDDPVLLAKDLQARREKLDKAGVDLAMKGVRNFQSKKAGGKKPAAGEKTKKAKAAKGTKTGSAPKAGGTLKLQPNPDGTPPTEAELEEMIKQFMAEQGEGETGRMKAEEKRTHEEL
ncbi:Hsp70 protein-domain-containing protein [Schizothecium vesticola]|uniref:Hsp70 protein-domain-containing protein n=1 Tax=Schizothecium vesticola TaxID=314040 RepID=A0AA40EJC5_9PEZI|nr:Hsp70 protein-domain-containing protein [Schizothecium vesticola]